MFDYTTFATHKREQTQLKPTFQCRQQEQMKNKQINDLNLGFMQNDQQAEQTVSANSWTRIRLQNQNWGHIFWLASYNGEKFFE